MIATKSAHMACIKAPMPIKSSHTMLVLTSHAKYPAAMACTKPTAPLYPKIRPSHVSLSMPWSLRSTYMASVQMSSDCTSDTTCRSQLMRVRRGRRG